MTALRVAVLGTGTMGAPMARNLARAGLEVRAWNRSRERAEPLAADGVAVADTPGEAADGADVALTMLSDGPAVLELVEPADGPLSRLAEGGVWLQQSTTGVEATDRFVALAAERGVPLVDAPVLGTRQPAEQGALTVLGSGPAEQRERLAPVFEAIAAKTLWVGEAGAGTRLKLVANTWLLSLVEGLAESIALAEGLGVDPADFFAALEGGPLDAGYVHVKGRAMVDRALDDAAFALRHAAKDAGLVAEAAGREGLDLPLVDTLVRRFREGVEAGHGDRDMAATFLTVAPGG
jgi:3-hydroxyisobutyrate dehydrogenase